MAAVALLGAGCVSAINIARLDPLTLLQDKAAQTTSLRPYAPPQGLQTATIALG